MVIHGVIIFAPEIAFYGCFWIAITLLRYGAQVTFILKGTEWPFHWRITHYIKKMWSLSWSFTQNFTKKKSNSFFLSSFLLSSFCSFVHLFVIFYIHCYAKETWFQEWVSMESTGVKQYSSVVKVQTVLLYILHERGFINKLIRIKCNSCSYWCTPKQTLLIWKAVFCNFYVAGMSSTPVKFWVCPVVVTEFNLVDSADHWVHKMPKWDRKCVIGKDQGGLR
jgi:hypothetical protein